MKVYFQKNKNDRMQIGTASSTEEANKMMMAYIQDELHFKSYYTRVMFDSKTKVTIDYGSHTQFFVFELDEEEAKNTSFHKLYGVKE